MILSRDQNFLKYNITFAVSYFAIAVKIVHIEIVYSNLNSDTSNYEIDNQFLEIITDG